MFINYSFWTVVAGSVAIGVAQPFILNCIGKVATYWFFKEHVINQPKVEDHGL